MPGRADPEGYRGLVLTIGHSARTFAQFLELLREAGVDHLVDVRRFPASRRNPQFDETVLGERLRREGGVRYSHLPGMGGRRAPRPDSPNAGWTNPSFRGYADHMATPEFCVDFERLVELCECGDRACLMCSEAVWWRCHRRMIADALLVRGFAVQHVLREHSRMLHALTPWAKVVDATHLLYPPPAG